MIQILWPDCQFIHLIRDGSATAVSMSRHPGYRWMATANEDSWSPASYNKYFSAVPVEERPMKEFGSLWFRRFQRIRDESKRLRADSYKEYRLEGFVHSPDETLRSMAAHVNLSSPEEWIYRAKSILDPDRIQNAPRRLDIMGQRELALLSELGYIGECKKMSLSSTESDGWAEPNLKR